MILAARGGNYSWSPPISPWGGDMGPFLSPSLLPSASNPVGLTAVAAAVRLVAESIGSFVMRVYQGDALDRRLQLDASQAALLQDGAEGYATSFDMWSDIATSIELVGNAFIWKARRPSGGVAELYAFPSEYVRVYVDDDGSKVIEARIGGTKRDITADVIHIRGWSPCVAVNGASTTDLHQSALRGSVALELYRGRYFDNDSTPNLVLIHPDTPTKQQRDDLRESWKARHGGPNGEKTGVLWGGMTVTQLTSSLSDSQVAELTNLDALQVARMFRIYPQGLLVEQESRVLPEAETVSDLFLRFTLLHRLRRIERAVSADRDLFPDRAVYARFDFAEFTRGSIATVVSKLHALKQVGMITANEGRSELGLEPSSDPKADELQATPVGGAPNATITPPSSE